MFPDCDTGLGRDACIGACRSAFDAEFARFVVAEPLANPVPGGYCPHPPGATRVLRRAHGPRDVGKMTATYRQRSAA